MQPQTHTESSIQQQQRPEVALGNILVFRVNVIFFCAISENIVFDKS